MYKSSTRQPGKLIMKHQCGRSPIVLVRRFSAQANPKVKPAKLPEPGDPLYRRLSRLGHKRGRVANTINEYLREGNPVKKSELDSCVKEFRRYNNFNLALEIMEWMEFRKINFARRDFGIRLELIAKVKGIADAESYFHSVSPSGKITSTYGSLLKCYCEEKMTDKALNLFFLMVKNDMVTKPLHFNQLMSLYLKLGKPERVVVLVEEMKKKDILPDAFTYNLLMNSYSALNDIEGVERVFEEMQLESKISCCNWTSYCTLASIYIKGGHREKADIALKKVEEVMGKNNREAYHFLTTLYAGNQDLQNVHRIWKDLKSRYKFVTNMSYLTMLQALKKLDDINGLKECYNEWESVCPTFDVRLTNIAMIAYLNHDMLDNVLLILQNAINKSDGPFFRSWEKLMSYFLKKGQVVQALEIMEVAISRVCDNDWQPTSFTIDEFLDYFRKEMDVSRAEEFYKLMKKTDCVDGHLYEALLQIYVDAGIIEPNMRIRIKEDEIEITGKLQDSLAVVCPK